ncbi:uncharacterized protein Dvar_14530 [Desulfosarcina variabilis str. Montpellier]|uniref:hypothetical protein n=1 Tax=Desulfosarcina variabilis TaxID=2300 RepID=UPI003AFA8E52
MTCKLDKSNWHDFLEVTKDIHARPTLLKAIELFKVQEQVKKLFTDFKVEFFHERDERGAICNSWDEALA